MKGISLALFKKIVVYAGLLALLFHFLFITVYLTDGKYTPDLLNRATERYSRPLFHQSWKIFAPEPPQWNVCLVYRCEFGDGTWSRWRDPGYPWLLKHYSNRFSYYGKMYALHTRIARELFNAAAKSISAENLFSGKLTEKDFQKVSETKAYQIAGEYLSAMSREEYPVKKARKIQFAYVAVFPLKFEKRNNQNPERKMKIIRFPEINLQN